MDLILNNKQNYVKDDIKIWYKDPHRVKYVLSGIAGSGKSTLIKYAVKELGIDEKDIAYCAYTGKASLVLLNKGNPNAMTIHKLIYDCKVFQDENGKDVFQFVLKEELEHNYKLIVVDEFSMVPKNMIKDLLSFNIKILAVGDNAQLPPVGDGTNDWLNHPDGILDEPLRQSLDNPILWLSYEILKGNKIKIGNYGDNLTIFDKKFLEPYYLENSDQIIAAKNATIDDINRYVRKELLDITDPMPRKDDKILCLRNNWNESIIDSGNEIYLVNGLIGFINNIKENMKSKTFTIDFQPTFSKEVFFDINIDGTEFLDERAKRNIDKKKLLLFRKPILESEVINNFKFGYAITTWKAQGSEWDNLLYVREMLGRNIQKALDYTAVTRAKENLAIAI